jgi:hypothetical protein
MTEVRELTPGELEAVAGALGCNIEIGCGECPRTVQEAWNAFFEAAGLKAPFH